MQCTRTLGDFPYSYCLYWFGPGEAVKDRYQPKLLENPIPLLLLLVAMDAHRLIPSKVKTFILCSIKLEWEIDKIMISLTHAVAYSWSDHRTCAWSRWRQESWRHSHTWDNSIKFWDFWSRQLNQVWEVHNREVKKRWHTQSPRVASQASAPSATRRKRPRSRS